MRHTFMEYQRGGYELRPCPCSGRIITEQLTPSPESRPGADASKVHPPTGRWAPHWRIKSWLTLRPLSQSWQHLPCCRERDTDGTKQPWAHGRHSPSTLTGKMHFGGKMLRCAMPRFQPPHWSSMCCEAHFSAYSTRFPLSSSCSSWCQAATKDSKGVYLPIMEEGGYRMFPVLKQNQANHSFLRVCPGNMYFCVWGWKQFQKITTLSA